MHSQTPRLSVQFTQRSLFLLPLCLLFSMIVYAPVHESIHALVGTLFGWQVAEVQLIPHFWHGEIFNAAYVRWEKDTISRTPVAETLVAAAPYLADIVIATLGLLIPRNVYERSQWHLWLLGLLFVWVPASNTLGNYVGAFFTHTDLSVVASHIGFPLMVVLFGISCGLLQWRFFSFVASFRKAA